MRLPFLYPSILYVDGAEYNMSESLISIIRLFNREGNDNCVIVRSGGEQSVAAPKGHNEGEPHLMSLERVRTRSRTSKSVLTNS